MSPFNPPSIKDEGLQKHLDAHYGKFGGYKEFVALIKAEVAVRAMARRFKVSRPTMTKWINVFREEKR